MSKFWMPFFWSIPTIKYYTVLNDIFLIATSQHFKNTQLILQGSCEAAACLLEDIMNLYCFSGSPVT